MVFSLTAVSPATLMENGGYLFQVQGTFEPGHRYSLHIGPLGSASDPACYSGVPGQGNTIYPWTTGILRAYSPMLDPTGGPYKVYVVDIDTSENHTLVAVMTVVYRDFRSSVFTLRKVLPLHWRTGPRDIELVPPT